MLNKILSCIVLAAVLAVTVAPAHAGDEEATWEGLQKVKSKRMDKTYLLHKYYKLLGLYLTNAFIEH